jgi:hypothetical protein
MKFAHFSHVWGKPNMTAHQRYEQLWRELELCDEIGFDYSFCVEHHFRPDESWMSSPALYAVAGGARTKRLRVGAMGFCFGGTVAVEDVNLLMRNYYVLRDLQAAILHGPGRRPASEQVFLTFAGPSDVLFSFVAEGAVAGAENRRPRQFPAGPTGLCSWGSECRIGEFNEVAGSRGRSQ